MAFNCARIMGCSLVTGEEERYIDNEPYYYNHDPSLLQRLKKTIGIDRRHTALPSTTTADLCRHAALRLLDALKIDASSIEAVISVTQTPDYAMPGNAHLLHRQLALPSSSLALDVTLGCSGYVYGLWLSAMMIKGGLRRVLLVAGDTLSKAVNAKDRTLAPLFGDAGSATIIELSDDVSDMYFALHSDGSGVEKMYIPAGAYRSPSTEKTRQENFIEEGCARSQEDLFMDGFGIFEFTMSEQPRLLREILAYSGASSDAIDYFIFHQANRYIVDTIVRAASIPREKAPAIFNRYGNQNSASIPGVLCAALADDIAGKRMEAVLQGYGAGLSWGACKTELKNLICLKPIPYSL